MGRWQVHEALEGATRSSVGGKGEFGRFVHGVAGDASAGGGSRRHKFSPAAPGFIHKTGAATPGTRGAGACWT